MLFSDVQSVERLRSPVDFDKTTRMSILIKSEYRISSYKARGYYFFIRPSTAGIIRMRVLFEGGYYFLKEQTLKIKTRSFFFHL